MTLDSKYSEEEIYSKLHEAESLISQAVSQDDAIQKLGSFYHAYYRWLESNERQHASQQEKRVVALEEEIARLKGQLADIRMNAILREAELDNS